MAGGAESGEKLEARKQSATARRIWGRGKPRFQLNVDIGIDSRTCGSSQWAQCGHPRIRNRSLLKMEIPNRRVPGIATQAAVWAGKGLWDSAPAERFPLRLLIRRVRRSAGNNPGHVPEPCCGTVPIWWESRRWLLQLGQFLRCQLSGFAAGIVFLDLLVEAFGVERLIAGLIKLCQLQLCGSFTNRSGGLIDQLLVEG